MTLRRRSTRRLPRAALALIAALGCAATNAAAPGPSATPVAGDQATFARTIDAARVAMLGDPVRARQLGHAAELQAMTWPKGVQRDVAIATAQWIEGEGAYRANDTAAAAPLTRAALAVAERVAPGSKLNADLLLSQARLQREAGEPQNALAIFQRAYNMSARHHDARGEAKALQSIGSIYQDAQDYDRVLYYYKQAEELTANDSLALSASNNMANAYLHLGRRREARLAYQRSLQLAKRLQSPLLVATILANLGDLAIEDHDDAAADAAIAAGLKLATRREAAGFRSTLLGTRAKLELTEGHIDDARRDIAAAFAAADGGTSDQSYSTLHLTAYHVYKAIGDQPRALEHLEAYRRLDEQARTLAASTNAALMTARFDFVNQNARIETLKSGQLRRDVALTRLRAHQSAVIFSSLLALLVVLLVFLFVYLRSVRRGRNEVMRANEQLAHSNLELADALQAKSQFLATTSHEIRTPLNGILGMTQVILADNGVGGVVRDRIGLVDAAGRAMRTLVDDILDFAKMDSGAIRLDAAPVDLRTVMADLVALWRVQAQDKGIDLRLSLTGCDAPLLTDAARLRQVVSNLLSNAVKFTPRGAVTVDVRREVDGGPAVAIVVADTGTGIPPGAFETIFEPFRQLDTSTTRQFGGTGLGLAISRHLARVLGGDITVAARPGGGSAFTVRLPYPEVTEPVASPVPTAAAVRVLVVSTNPIRRSFLRTALAAFGRTGVCDPADLSAFLAATAVGIVLVDLGEEDDAAGPDLVLAAVGAAVPVVLLVPVGLAARNAAWHAAGAARVVTKPLRVDALAAVLHAELGVDGDGDHEAITQTVVFEADLP